jgi:UDP-N-acetylglucosamine 1-carboxyvinyltransferase
MSQIKISGGHPLKGNISVYGAKNVGFKLMIAALLADTPSKIDNLSEVADVYLVQEIIASLGAQVRIDDHTASITPPVTKYHLPTRLGERARASTMFLPVLLHLFGQAEVPYPGGDKIGKRPIDRHLDGLEALGIKIKTENNHLVASGKLIGNYYRFHKATHTGTETMVMAAAVAEGETILENCALEPEVDDLIAFLNKMGAKIERQNRMIRISGVKKLTGADFKVMPDQNEVVTFACMALATRGEVTIQGVEISHITAFLEKVQEAGGKFETGSEKLKIWWEAPLQKTVTVTQPYPGFKTDWQPIWTALMTQAEGESEVHETVFEHRFNYVPLLNEMGARIELFNHDVENKEEFYNFNLEDDRPEYFHAARIFGPTRLHGQELPVPDIRAGSTLTLAALVADGETTLTGIDHIERGYEKLEERLANLGAQIRKVV